MNYISVHFQILKHSCSYEGPQIASAIILESLVSEGIVTSILSIVRLTKPFILPTFFTKTPTPTVSNSVLCNVVVLNQVIRLWVRKTNQRNP
jgi:hypothetical protein